MQPPRAPEVRFNQEHVHHLVRSDKRSTCKVHIQRVDTFYGCAVCGIHIIIISDLLIALSRSRRLNY